MTSIDSGADVVVATSGPNSNVQYDHSVAALPGGGFVVSWLNYVTRDTYPYTTAVTVEGAVYNADGSLLSNFTGATVNGGFSELAILYADVATLPSGQFVVAWASINTTTNEPEIDAQIFNSDGTAATSEFSAIMGASRFQSLTVLTNGTFAIVGVGSNGIVGNVFNPNGSPVIGGSFSIAVPTSLAFRFPKAVALANGGFLVDWLTNGSGSAALDGQLFTSNGTTDGPPFAITDTSNSLVATAALADGQLVFAWTTSINGIITLDTRVFNADGSPSTNIIQVSDGPGGYPGEPALAALPDGNFVLAWGDSTVSSSGDDLYTLTRRNLTQTGLRWVVYLRLSRRRQISHKIRLNHTIQISRCYQTDD